MGYCWESVGHRWTIGGIRWDTAGPSMKGPQRLVALQEYFRSTGMHALINFDKFWKVATSKIISKVLQNEVKTNSSKNTVGYLPRSIRKSNQNRGKIRFYSRGWPTEIQSTLAELPTSRCKEKPHQR